MEFWLCWKAWRLPINWFNSWYLFRKPKLPGETEKPFSAGQCKASQGLKPLCWHLVLLQSSVTKKTSKSIFTEKNPSENISLLLVSFLLNLWILLTFFLHAAKKLNAHVNINLYFIFFLILFEEKFLFNACLRTGSKLCLKYQQLKHISEIFESPSKRTPSNLSLKVKSSVFLITRERLLMILIENLAVQYWNIFSIDLFALLG